MGVKYCALNSVLWQSPPFADYLRKQTTPKIDEMAVTKPLLLLSNKYQAEWNGPLDFYSVDTLRQLLKLLLPHYTVFYLREDAELDTARKKTSMSKATPLKDKEMLREEFPDVLLVEEFVRKWATTQVCVSFACTAARACSHWA